MRLSVFDSFFEGFAHRDHSRFCIRFQVFGLQRDQQTMEYLAVNETNPVFIDWLNLEKMLASEEHRQTNMELPGELAIGFYRGNRAEKVHFA